MTATEIPESIASPELKPVARKTAWLAYGAGVAIEIGDRALEVAVSIARPSGSKIARRFALDQFRDRPASEWGAEYAAALRGLDAGAALVLLPRKDVIVRYVALPGVPKREIPQALALRLRALHPFAEDDVAWCWSQATTGALVGLVRQSVLDRYEALFAEAGVQVAGFTFSAAVLGAVAHLYSGRQRPFLAVQETAPGVVEIYGESPSGAVYSSEYAGSLERAAAAGRAELRLAPDAPVSQIEDLLPPSELPTAKPVVCAASIAAACPLIIRPANFLPPERRAGRNPVWFIPTAILLCILIAGLIVLGLAGPWREARYRAALSQRIAAIEPQALRAQSLDKKIDATLANISLLDNFKARSKSDFDVLNELTRILPPPTWAGLVEIYPDRVILSGETDQAAPLLHILDSSPLFHGSEFMNSVARTAGGGELFHIKTMRGPK